MAREDDIVTQLNHTSTVEAATALLNSLPTWLLRKVVDLMGIDAVYMGKRTAIVVILAETFAPCETAGTWSDTQTNAGLAGTVDPNFAGI